MRNSTTTYMKALTLFLVFLGITIIFILLPPIPQPLAYMQLADTRTLFGIPYFGDVISNLLFAVLGIIGLVWPGRYDTKFQKHIYQLFFIGVFLVSFGSSYYHWSPSYWSLLWDRLPIATAMMSFLTAMIDERVGEKFAKICWIPLLLLGIFSVCYWYYSEINGFGDLRLYLFTQLFPVVIIPTLLLLYRRPKSGYLWAAIGTYFFARASEHFDHGIYTITHTFVSGHTLKHVFMAIGILFIYLYKKHALVLYGRKVLRPYR